ncbi:cupin domain-containing protein [Aurantibacter crassamenti]|uniref:cupin domain-containing protein n=1 Tax=Aurantibacter crassamenti TaxID=1837375 RepID=UPI00193980B1|nr:cupin domain-containing protein [Aurantibacter crassamenti]MBM1105684.1 cupin domain-containing protein [Aurantibacter crassamenti]
MKNINFVSIVLLSLSSSLVFAQDLSKNHLDESLNNIVKTMPLALNDSNSQSVKAFKNHNVDNEKSNIMKELKPVRSGVYKWKDYPVKYGNLSESRSIMEGTSPHFEYLEMHATTKFPGAEPSTAHANAEYEECIIVKEGKMKVTIEGKSTILEAGGVILLMPQQMHSLANVGDTNLTYTVMKYKSKKKMNIERGVAAGGSLTINKDSLTFKPSKRGGGIAYFDRPTAMCDRFEMHITQLDEKGPSHKPHAHDETEIIMVLSGKTEMTIDGKEYEASAGDFYFMDSQLFHGVRNATDETCSYFAFKWK